MTIKTAIFKKSIRGTNDILLEPIPQVAFIGRSNVGKSSLMNCLFGKKNLVKSGKTPGKTREINFFLVNKSTYFVDLPGYGYAKLSFKTREQLIKMIQWYFEQEVLKRKVVLVLDMKVGPSEMDLEMLQILRQQNQEIIVVANKTDNLNQRERNIQIKKITSQMPGLEIIPCSAKTGMNRDKILEKIFS